ncbi:MAG: phosphoribosylanthranilate isomerase [Pseudomonadales bacterium]|nr:phosphoribosylanthranilate isomerase [Pseudomonadales bacterium]
MARTRSKICGITRVEDAQQASEAGVDAIGLVFYAASKRVVTLERAQAIQSSLPAFVSTTALFVNPQADAVKTVLAGMHLDLLQFHGDEPADFCRSFKLPYMKAIRVRPGLDVGAEIGRYPDAAAILLDTWDAEQAGGTGLQFDWSVARQCVRASAQKIVLAGGLNAQNVGEAIRQVRPYAVDVSSGVEAAPGIKDSGKIIAFMQEVCRVQA